MRSYRFREFLHSPQWWRLGFGTILACAFASALVMSHEGWTQAPVMTFAGVLVFMAIGLGTFGLPAAILGFGVGIFVWAFLWDGSLGLVGSKRGAAVTCSLVTAVLGGILPWWIFVVAFEIPVFWAFPASLSVVVGPVLAWFLYRDSDKEIGL